jgi:autotransporter-associated beta strand protein
MTIAPSRDVSNFFGTSLRSAFKPALLVGASSLALTLLSSTAQAACNGDGTPNTCTLVLTPPGANEADIVAGTGDGGTGTDTLVFNTAGLTLNANAIGSTLGGTVRFINYEAAHVTAGSSLTLTGTISPTAPTQSLTWTIDATGSLFARGGDAIGNGSAMTVNGLFEIGGGAGPTFFDETIGSLAGAGSVSLLNSRVLTAGGNGSSTTFSGVMSGNGGFEKVGTGKLILTGANTFSGPLRLFGGTLEVGNTNAISLANGVTVSGAELTSKGVTNYVIGGPLTITATQFANGRVTGNAIVNGNVSSNGGLQPGNTSVPTFPAGTTAENPGQDMGSMRINGNYTATGANAYVGMFVNVDAALAVNTAAGTLINTQTGTFASPLANGTAGTTHDFLDIVGNITGTTPTMFAVASFTAAPVGGATSGNGIQVIRVTGTNSGNDFRQGSALNAGAYQYVLRYVGNYNLAGDDGYFLQSAARDELVAHPALLTAGQNLIRNCFRDDQRVPDSPKGASYGRAWFGYRQGNTNHGADTGLEMDQDFSCTSGGMDWRLGHGWFGGVSGGFGSSRVDLTTAAGPAQLDGDARVIEAYASFTSSSLFVNLSAGYNDMDWIHLGTLMGAEAASSGFIGSAQAGVALDAEVVAVKLFGSINYDGTNCGDSCFGFAVVEDTGTVEAKGTVRFDGVSWGGSVRPWAAVSYTDIVSGGINSASVGAVTVTSDTLNQLLSIDGGLQTYLDENLSLYLDGGYHESLGKDVSGYKGAIGMKLYW